MFHNALAHLKGQVQALEADVALLEMLHDAQRMQVVIEPPAVGPHQLIEFALPGVPKRRVADVVNQGEGFHKIGVEAKRGRHRARDLRNFQRVR